MGMGCWTIFACLFASKKRRVAADPARPAAGAVDMAQEETILPAPPAQARPSSAPAPAQETLADLTDPAAAHLLLGLNLEGLREACELVGFPYERGGADAWQITYERDDHPEMKWLYEAFTTLT